MINKDKYVLIMAGGSGTRFWPISTTKKPKQFLDILGTGKTLLQDTADRFKNVCPLSNIYIITNKKYSNLVKKQLPFINRNQILLEPIKRNTAPCIAYASFKIYALNKNATICVSPADHYISDRNNFKIILNKTFEKILNNELLTLGIKPTSPHTGYGYIKYNKKAFVQGKYKAESFVEKPDLKQAKLFITKNNYLWNSGIFIWKAKTIIEEFEKHAPKIYAIFNAGKNKLNTETEQNFINKAFLKCENISIDYAIIEKSIFVYVMPINFNWVDLGTWESLFNHLKKIKHQNVIMGKNILTYNSKNNLIKSNKKLVIIEDLNDYIVAESKDVLLICKKKGEKKIKEIINDTRKRFKDKFI